MKSNELMGDLCGALDAELGPCKDFDQALGELIGKRRRRHSKDVRDMEIAQLIPHGIEPVMERFGGHKRINQYRASRGRDLLKRVQRNFP